jgi:hypothetical protein
MDSFFFKVCVLLVTANACVNRTTWQLHVNTGKYVGQGSVLGGVRWEGCPSVALLALASV